MTPQPTYRGQWVSVKEMLPASDIRVSVFTEYGIVNELFYSGVGKSFFHPMGGIFKHEITH